MPVEWWCGKQSLNVGKPGARALYHNGTVSASSHSLLGTAVQAEHTSQSLDTQWFGEQSLNVGKPGAKALYHSGTVSASSRSLLGTAVQAEHTSQSLDTHKRLCV
jgi:predicted short-subunit dehydrogenase-like oxidoreductase (DUF2520 family)